VRAFRITSHNYSAQYGGGAGALMATASRSGGNKVHGGLAYMTRESAWAATNPFSVETHYRDGVMTTVLAKPHDALQNLRGRIGGPIAAGLLRRRLTGFVSVEEQFRNFPAVSSPSVRRSMR
jgi:hypothetical protein